jgi:Type II CAAX prenyl endopeptidase Rce1-like
MTYRTRLFGIVFLAGFIGILSILLIDLNKVLTALPVAKGSLPMSPWAIKLLGLVQPAILVAAAALIGVLLAERVSLSAPAFEALASGNSFIAALRPQILSGVVGGLIGALALVSSWIVARSALPPEFVARAERFNRVLPVPTRFLYGGITEEVLLRWGFLTLLVWAGWKLFQRGSGKPRSKYFIGAILISSIVFGIAHLPLGVALGGITIPIAFYIVIANSIFGLIAGYLYWRKGLEAGIIAHMITHVGIVTAGYFSIIGESRL